MTDEDYELSRRVTKLLSMDVPIIGRSREWKDWEMLATSLGPAAAQFLMLALAVGPAKQHYGAILALRFCGFEAGLCDDNKPAHYEVRKKGSSEVTKIIPVEDPLGDLPGSFTIGASK